MRNISSYYIYPASFFVIKSLHLSQKHHFACKLLFLQEQKSTFKDKVLLALYSGTMEGEKHNK